MKSNNAQYMNYKDFLQGSEEPALDAAIWKWGDIERELADAFETDPLSPGRAAVSLVNSGTDKALGVSRTLNMLVQAFEPGDHGKPHRHSNFAIFIVRQGHGYSIIEGEKITWEEGDVFFAPAWARHEHCNSSETERAVLYTVQDVPTVTNMGTWFFQGSEDKGFKHNVKQGE